MLYLVKLMFCHSDRAVMICQTFFVLGTSLNLIESLEHIFTKLLTSYLQWEIKIWCFRLRYYDHFELSLWALTQYVHTFACLSISRLPPGLPEIN